MPTQVSKAIAYAVVTAPALNISKALGYAVVSSEACINISKAIAYAVVSGEAPSAPPPPQPPKPPVPLPTDNSNSFLRKAIPSSMKGAGWNALIAALSPGLDDLRDQGLGAYDQLHLATATDGWLDKRASGEGMERPRNVGMDDETFRKLVILTRNDKLTIPAFLEVLELFYDLDSTRAHVTTGAAPFGLADGDTLVLKLDGHNRVTVRFSDSNFSFISAATTTEVAAGLNFAFARAEVAAVAIPTTDPVNGSAAVTIYAAGRGLRGSLEVVGGTALTALGLSVGKHTLYDQVRPAYVKGSGTNALSVVMPATSAVVARADGDAAYLENEAAVEGTSPYLYDDSGVALTETVTTTTTTIAPGTLKLLAVASASAFPDQPGYLVVAFGAEEQVVVPYIGVASATQLLLDPSFGFTKHIKAGATVNLLAGRDAPESVPGEDGDLWLVPSAAGRAACIKTLQEIAAAGYDLHIRVQYPGDVGLGNAGQPTHGAAVLSDVVKVFADDNIEAEVASAMEDV